MSNMVTGIFKNRRAADLAVEQLNAAGFTDRDISVLMSDETRGREFGVQDASKAPEGAVTGAAAGGTLGAIAAGLIAVGVIAVPGLGLLAAGPLLAVLAGAGAGGAAGGLLGGLIGAGVPEHEANILASDVAEGGILLGVYAHDDNAKQAETILKSAGAKSVAQG